VAPRDALAAIFPHAAISETGRLIENSSSSNDRIPYPDALKAETVYRVVAPPRTKAEQCAAQSVITMKYSRVRELRMRAYDWPGDPEAVLVVLQYRFLHASSAMSCLSIARLVRLALRDGRLRVEEDLVLDTTHHSGVERVELTDLDGDAVPALVIESDAGGGGIRLSNIHAFSLAEGRFRKWVETVSRLRDWSKDNEQQFQQVLDVERTTSYRAAKFCFTKSEFVVDGVELRKPRVTKPCYARELSSN
jgi:hypothetical protein